MVKRIFLILVCFFIFSPAYALSCGEGKIIAVDVGGWNTDDLYIRLDYSVSPSSLPGTEFSGLIVYRKANLDPTRFSGIRAIALAAYIAGRTVRPYTHSGRCDNATELTLGKLSG